MNSPKQTVIPHSEHLENRHLIEIGKTYTSVSPYDFTYHWRVDEKYTSKNDRMFSEGEALVEAKKFIQDTFGGSIPGPY
jgi:hypothetical protein